jgi:hypothetical protein
MSQHERGGRGRNGAPAMETAVGALLAAVVHAGALATTAGAQQEAPTPGERRGALSASLGVGSALSSAGGCGKTATAALAAGFRWRAWRASFVEATATAAGGLPSGDCLDVATPAPGVFRTTTYDNDPDNGTFATALRTGLEGAAGPLRVRAAAGLGRMWEPRVTYGTAALSASVGPRVARLLVEVEQWWFTLDALHTDTRFEDGRALHQTITPARIRERPRLVRVGVEVPVGPRR